MGVSKIHNNKFEILVYALSDALGRSDGQSLDAVEKELTEEGYDVQGIIKKVREEIKMNNPEIFNLTKKK